MRGKLIVGVLYNGQENLWDWTLERMVQSWGKTQRISPIFPFSHTCYYKEIDTTLFRRFVSFAGLFEGFLLSEHKTQAIALEKESGNPRNVNIDPGLLDGARLLLSSTKDRAQRIPISRDLYAEVTLRYKGKKWISFDYTFPDFRLPTYYDFLETLRRDVLEEKRKEKELHDTSLQHKRNEPDLV